jgi:hypothetical protein
VNKKVAIMQPYFFPYIGYFQLIKSVDEFIIYDNIQYTKKGWINRNRILVNGTDKLVTLSIKKDSDYLDIMYRELSNSWESDRQKILNLIKTSYYRAPFFEQTYDLIKQCLFITECNLFGFIYNILQNINNHLSITTPIIKSSDIEIDHTLKSEQKVIALCKKREATTYINAIGGVGLYDKDRFKQCGLELNFIKSNPITYKQFNNKFIPWLSIIDVLMFNSPEIIKEYINSYTLI